MSFLSHIDILFKILANTILVSIPEEAFIVLFTVILLGTFNFLDYENVGKTGAKVKSIDIIKASICTIIPATISNVMRYTGGDYLVSFLMLIGTLILSILIVYGMWRSLKDIGKTLLFMFIACAIVYTIEALYVPFVMRSIGKSMSEINDSILYNFLIFLPERLIEGFLLVFLLTKKSTILKANLFQPILKSSVLLAMTLTIIIFDVGFMGILCYIIGYSNILANVPNLFQILIVVGAFLVPILNISIFLWGLYLKENQKRERNVLHISTVKNYITDIRKKCEEIKDSDKAKSMLEDLRKIEIEVLDLKED